MKLKNYLQENGIKATFFAKRVGVSQPTLYTWLHGEHSPNIKFAHKIEQITKGEVKLKDWVDEDTFNEDTTKRKQSRSNKQLQLQNNISLSDHEISPEKPLS